MPDRVRFYIGETVTLLIEALDEITHLPLDITNYEFLIYLYTDRFEPIKMSTTDEEGTLKVERVDNDKLEVTIPSSRTSFLRPGEAKIEVLACYKPNEQKSIALLPLVEFLPSEIGKISQCHDSKD